MFTHTHSAARDLFSIPLHLGVEGVSPNDCWEIFYYGNSLRFSQMKAERKQKVNLLWSPPSESVEVQRKFHARLSPIKVPFPLGPENIILIEFSFECFFACSVLFFDAHSIFTTCQRRLLFDSRFYYSRGVGNILFQLRFLRELGVLEN